MTKHECAIVMAHTGICMLTGDDFGIYHEYIEKIMGRPVWTHELAIQKMVSSHIGIMPLLENPYTLGKGGFKLIQYMSVALPVIASEVGYNSYVVDSSFGYLVPNEQPELWVEYLLKTSASWSDYLSMSTTSKRIYD